MSNHYDDDDYGLYSVKDASDIFNDIEDLTDDYDHDKELRLDQLMGDISNLEGFIIQAAIDGEPPAYIGRLEDELELLTLDYYKLIR